MGRERLPACDEADPRISEVEVRIPPIRVRVTGQHVERARRRTELPETPNRVDRVRRPGVLVRLEPNVEDAARDRVVGRLEIRLLADEAHRITLREEGAGAVEHLRRDVEAGVGELVPARAQESDECPVPAAVVVDRKGPCADTKAHQLAKAKLLRLAVVPIDSARRRSVLPKLARVVPLDLAA